MVSNVTEFLIEQLYVTHEGTHSYDMRIQLHEFLWVCKMKLKYNYFLKYLKIIFVVFFF